MPMKRCKRCQEWLFTDMYSAQKDGRLGVTSKCKKCRCEERKIWYDTNREDIQSRRKAWVLSHPKFQKYGRNLFEVWKLTEDQFEKMLEAQHGVCAICGSEDKATRVNPTGRLSIDHCHKTGKIRGLLCRKCNTGIGNLKDDVLMLERAIEYLNNFGSVVERIHTGLRNQRLRA